MQLDTDNLKKQMTKVFNYFDDDHSGYLDAKKIKKMTNECFFNIEDDMIEKMIQVNLLCLIPLAHYQTRR